MIIKATLHTFRQPHLSQDALREGVADIDGEVARLNRIVADVLDFARPISFQMQATDINALCGESAAAAQAGAGCTIRLELEQSLPLVTTDSDRLRTALVNLLVNARQAAGLVQPSGGSSAHPVPHVTLRTHLADRGMVISVIDNGPGIPDGDIARAFEPFFTTTRGGTGLGLPITKNIIDGLGGTLVAASQVGIGTHMRVEIPMAPHTHGQVIPR